MAAQSDGDGVRERRDALAPKADRGAAADATQLVDNFLGPLTGRERRGCLELERAQAAERLGNSGDIAAALTDIDEHLIRLTVTVVNRNVGCTDRGLHPVGPAG